MHTVYIYNYIYIYCTHAYLHTAGEPASLSWLAGSRPPNPKCQIPAIKTSSFYDLLWSLYFYILHNGHWFFLLSHFHCLITTFLDIFHHFSCFTFPCSCFVIRSLSWDAWWGDATPSPSPPRRDAIGEPVLVANVVEELQARPRPRCGDDEERWLFHHIYYRYL
jgi:hypothetical protein